MVYDPIRDCDVPSPAASLQNPSPWADHTPGSDRLSASVTYPPGFQNDRRSPGIFRTASGGMRNMLNEEGGAGRDSRNGSFSSAGPEDHLPPPRNRGINSLLNEGIAPPISQTSSASSISHTALSYHSPGPKPYSLLDHDGFLAPTTPASGFARSSRSPYPAASPALSLQALPHEGHHQMTNTYRSPNLFTHDPLPMRSPSVSVSPRHQLHNLPPNHLPSRPGSSSSAGGYPYPTSLHYESPSHSYQQLSDHPQRPRSNSRLNDPPSRPRSSSKLNDPPSRRSSISASYVPRPPRSPSPVRFPYAPHNRITAPSSVLVPISRKEVDTLKAEGLSNNPLRGKHKPPPPSWSGITPSPSLHRTSESGNSYFPGDNSVAGPSTAAQKRKVSDVDNSRQSSRAPSNGGSDFTRRKVSEAKYMGNNALVADHCTSFLPSG
jgi:mRNA (guanine-N7-)-methyltransferase